MRITLLRPFKRMPDGSIVCQPMPRKICRGCGSDLEWRALLGSVVLPVPDEHLPGMVYFSFCPNTCMLCDICSRPLRRGELCDCMQPCPKCGVEKYRYGECLFCTTDVEPPDPDELPENRPN